MKETLENEVPCLKPLEGVYQLVAVSASLSPSPTTNCFVIGESGGAAVIVDPSPKGNEDYRKLLNTINRLAVTHAFGYTKLFITHHHWDHHQHAPQLARELGLSITISHNSYERIINRAGADYFENIAIHHPNEGDIMVHWQGEAVKVFHVPGHDEGHLALAPANMAWFLVGDLIQGAGTVVIGTDEGDMSHYFQTLERIITLKPKILFPSHGETQYSTRVLKKTLKHRLEREKQVLKLHKTGHSPEQMVEQIYSQVDQRLWPLALENIKSHLKKLQQDDAVDRLAPF